MSSQRHYPAPLDQKKFSAFFSVFSNPLHPYFSTFFLVTSYPNGVFVRAFFFAFLPYYLTVKLFPFSQRKLLITEFDNSNNDNNNGNYRNLIPDIL